MSPSPSPSTGGGTLPVVLVVLDTLRADMVDRPDLLQRLPTLRRLFGESYVFTRAYAPAHWTLPSHASLFTGLAPSDHMARPPRMKLRADVPTAAEIFRQRGYLTACITCNPSLSDVFGMTRGFDFVWTSPPRKSVWLLKKVLDRLSDPARQNGSFLRAVRTLGEAAFALLRSTSWADNGARRAARLVKDVTEGNGGSLFLVVNLMEAHTPYHGRGAFAGWRRRLEHADVFGAYEAFRNAVMGDRLPISDGKRRALERIYWENVRYLDAQLEVLLRNLPEGFLERGLLILVSDHGQLFGERGGIDHVAGLSEALLHVPLVIRPPGGTGGERIGHPLAIAWVFNLLRAVAADGGDALPSWMDWTANQDVVFSEASGDYVPYAIHLRAYDPESRRDLLAFKAKHDHPALACIAGRWKLICHLGRKEDEVYDLAKDPKEEVNLVSERDDILQELHEKLKARYLGRGRDLPRESRRDRLPLDAKRAIAATVLAAALEGEGRPALLCTGGKDSTLVLRLALDAARARGVAPPPLVFVDHGQHFPETWSFMDAIAKEEGLTIVVARNEDLLDAVAEGAETVPLESLDAENQEEALKAGLEGTDVPLSLDTPVGNHLLKTVALNRALRTHKFDAVITGIRWDENPARATEVFFSPRDEPPHVRVHPILPWTEREVWTYTLSHDLPIHPLYRKGYRSFDGVFDSEPTDTRPAWEQDLEASAERAGRAQDKEEIMERLRALGYF